MTRVEADPVPAAVDLPQSGQLMRYPGDAPGHPYSVQFTLATVVQSCVIMSTYSSKAMPAVWAALRVSSTSADH